MPKPDEAHRVTDVLLSDLEARLKEEYGKAAKEAQAKLDDYLRRFREKDKIKRKQWEAEEITRRDYQQWRTGQIMMGQHWQNVRDELARDFRNADRIARGIIDGEIPVVYALNHNFATFSAEHESLVDTSAEIYVPEAVAYIMKENPELLPPPGRRIKKEIAEGRALRWGRQQVQSCMATSILLGDSIPEIAKRVSRELGSRSLGDSVRYARTAITGAENKGRDDAYNRVEKKGVPLSRMWLATLDNRTRHSHRHLHGEIRRGERYSNGLRWPGDTSGNPSEYWNCRCCETASVAGLERDAPKTSPKLGGMSFEEWMEARPAYNPQTLPVEKARAIKAAHIANYRRAAERLK